MPDYIFMLESRLMPDQLRVLNFLQEEAQEAQLNLYLAGGAVRDLLTGSSIQDLDFVFEGNPLKLVKRFAEPAPDRVVVDEENKSAELLLQNGVRLSLAMARSETYQEPGKPPVVRPAIIIDDLRRRDFTVNAIGISLAPGSRGLMMDPTNGLADIESRELRTLHNYSFLHDPSRLLRLVRFGARLGYMPEERTQEQFESALERGYLDYLERRHLRRELEQITYESNTTGVLRALQAREMLALFHPALQRRGPDYDNLSFYQKHRQHAEETGYCFDTFPAVLYYILKRLSKSDAKKLLRNAGMDAAEVKQFKKWLPEAKKMVAMINRARNAKPKPIYQMLEQAPLGVLVFVMAEFRHKKHVQSKISTNLFKHRLYRAAMPVQELETLGVARGAEFDKILEAYFDAQLNGRIRKGVEVETYLRKLAGIPEPKPVEEEPPKKPEKVPTKKTKARAATEKSRSSLVRKALMKKVASRKTVTKGAKKSVKSKKKSSKKAAARKSSRKGKSKVAGKKKRAVRKTSRKKSSKKGTARNKKRTGRKTKTKRRR